MVKGLGGARRSTRKGRLKDLLAQAVSLRPRDFSGHQRLQASQHYVKPRRQTKSTSQGPTLLHLTEPIGEEKSRNVLSCCGCDWTQPHTTDGS